MPNLCPIPSPWSRRWRSIRFRLLPLLVFGGATALTVWLLGRRASQGAAVVGIARGRIFQVSATYAGRIRSIPVRLFDRVSRGQVVAVMDDDWLAAQIATISEEINRLRAEYEQDRAALQADLANRRAEWQAEHRAFVGDVLQLKVRILELEAALEEDRALLEGLALEVTSASRLVNDRALAAIELERARAAHGALAAKVHVNEDALSQLEAERSAAEKLAAGYAHHRPVSPCPEIALRHLRKAVRVQEGLIRELEAQRSETVLRAPFDGIVIEIQQNAGDVVLRRPGEGVLRRAGEVVAAGEPILAIAETAPSEVIAYASEHQMSDLREGAVVEIGTRTHPRRTARSRTVAVAPTVERLPERLWTNAQVPMWGRPFRVSIPPGMKLSPGELVWVRRR